jgi:hypothetical protein
MPEFSNRTLLAAVVHADQGKLTEFAGISEGTAPHLVPAREQLKEALRITVEQNPDSELAKRVTELLNQEKLFYIVGKWPPDQSSGGLPGSGGVSSPARFCRHCGVANP